MGAKDAAAEAMAVAEEDTARAGVEAEAVGVVAVGVARERVAVGWAGQVVVVEVAGAARWRRADRVGSARELRR